MTKTIGEQKNLKEQEDEKEIISSSLPLIKDNKVNDENSLKYNDNVNLKAHNDAYSTLLNAYVYDYMENSKKKRKYKNDILEIVISQLVFVPIIYLVIVSILLMFIALKFSYVNVIAGLITSTVSLIGTMYVILQIVVKYLFNKDEEKNLTTIVSKVQEYDSKIRDTQTINVFSDMNNIQNDNMLDNNI